MADAGARPPVWIVGAGAIGQYLAARLAAVADVTLVSRGDRTAALQERGITISGRESRHVRVRVVAAEDRAAPPLEAPVLIATKVTQLGDALASVRLLPGATLGLCQNGLGVGALAAELAPDAVLVRVGCWFGVSQVGPAEVSLAGLFQLELGADDPRAADGLCDLLGASGLPLSRAPSLAACEWRKSLWNVAVSGACALLDVRNGAVLDDPDLRALAQALVAEAVAVAAAEGVTLEADGSGTAAATVFASTEKTRGNYNAMVFDLRRSVPTEMPWLNGAVARLARAHGLSAPTNEAVSRLVAAAERRPVESLPGSAPHAAAPGFS